MSIDPSLARRRFLFGAGALGASAVLVGCTSNESGADQPQQVAQGGGDNAAKGKQVTIGFSAPAADHGWIAAITKNAQALASPSRPPRARTTSTSRSRRSRR
jgi:ribose transport system substrate-binding protein